MFLGSYEPSFDKKTRRIALPKKIRDYLAKNEIILSFGFENCIFGFDTKNWQKQAKQELSRPITHRGARDTRRFLFAAAELVTFDDQGRFVIPDSLLKFAKIEKPIVVGAGDHFEIWNLESWQKHKSNLPPQE